jgi:tetratricopeptide (TPR) repeat protein
MRAHKGWIAVLAAVLATSSPAHGGVVAPSVDATSGAIALANLDQQIAQLGGEPSVVEFLLVRSRFLGDFEALDLASDLAEGRYATRADLLRRARTRSAVHRFADALADLAAATRLGAKAEEVDGIRSSILVATGHAAEVIPELEAGLAHQPGFASRSALAVAYAAVGRLAEADDLYVGALSDLDTTSPFPYAWVYFARGLMWSEQGKDKPRGEALYLTALSYLPQFVAAAIHVAEIEVARGDLASAVGRLERVVASSKEPEALALLGQLRIRMGDAATGHHQIDLAQERYEWLLARQPLAFADHGAEFFLGAGGDPEYAWVLAKMNLANRTTDRAFALAIRAALAAGHLGDACNLALSARAEGHQVPEVACPIPQ